MIEAASTLAPAEARSRTSSPPPALAAELLHTCAGGAAVGSAIELGVLARVAERPADPESVAADCGLTVQELRRS